MSKFTLYRADVDSPRLERVLGKLPGVAVADEAETDATATDDEVAAPGAPPESQDDDGLQERIPVPDTDIGDEETKSVVKTYGPLGLGVSMVLLGISTIGIWVYLRRRGGDSEAETPPPATGLDADGTTPAATAPSSTEPGPSTTAETASDSATPAPSIVRPDEGDDEAVDERSDDEDAESPGRTEGDRSDVEWTTKETTPATGPDESTPSEPEEPGVETGDEDDAHPGESVDAAPLLGVAFLALSGAVVNWLQSGDDA